jgi:hypothetical protein
MSLENEHYSVSECLVIELQINKTLRKKTQKQKRIVVSIKKSLLLKGQPRSQRKKMAHMI